MRALVCHAYGPIESLKLEDVPKPEPAPGEILVKVGAAGICASDSNRNLPTCAACREVPHAKRCT